MAIEPFRFVGLGEFDEGLGRSVKAEGVELVEGGMFRANQFLLMIVARAADIFVLDRGRSAAHFGAGFRLRLVVEVGFDRAIGLATISMARSAAASTRSAP